MPRDNADAELYVDDGGQCRALTESAVYGEVAWHSGFDAGRWQDSSKIAGAQTGVLSRSREGGFRAWANDPSVLFIGDGAPSDQARALVLARKRDAELIAEQRAVHSTRQARRLRSLAPAVETTPVDVERAAKRRELIAEQRAVHSTRQARRLRSLVPAVETTAVDDERAAKRRADEEARRADSLRDRRLLATFAALVPKSEALLASAKGTPVGAKPPSDGGFSLAPLVPRPNLQRVGGAFAAEDVTPRRESQSTSSVQRVAKHFKREKRTLTSSVQCAADMNGG